MTDVQVISELLKPYDAQQMRSYPVSMRISRVANDDAECSALVEQAQIQNRLFSCRSTLLGVRCRNVRLHIGVMLSDDLPFASVLFYDL
ncbi:MAG: hypothetical protein WCA20_18680 [Candidatus Sulfotelmatobacter sp.]